MVVPQSMAITISDNRMPDTDAVDTAVVRKLRGLRLAVCPTAGCVIALATKAAHTVQSVRKTPAPVN